MSPLWPETVQLAIGPAALCLSRRGEPALSLPCSGDWDACLAALPALPRRTRLAVCVADRHVRYLRLDWPAGLKAGERAAFVEHRFHAVFGAGPWVVQADRDAICLPSLGVALPAALEAALQGFVRSRGLRLVALEPAFPRSYNRLRPRLRGDGALARLEAGRVTLGLWQGGQWRAVRSQPVARADAAAAVACLITLLATLPPAAATSGNTSGNTLYLCGATDSAATIDTLPAGWRGVHLEGGE